MIGKFESTNCMFMCSARVWHRIVAFIIFLFIMLVCILLMRCAFVLLDGHCSRANPVLEDSSDDTMVQSNPLFDVLDFSPSSAAGLIGNRHHQCAEECRGVTMPTSENHTAPSVPTWCCPEWDGPDGPFAPQSYFCPITQQIMRDPVLLGDGHSYERLAINQWLQTHNTSP